MLSLIIAVMMAAAPMGHRLPAVAPVSPDSIAGVVTDSAGAPLAAVDVLVPELGRGTQTDAGGRFALGDVAPGRRTIVFRRSGYAPATRVVEVPTSTELSVRLRETPFRLEPVNVTATRSPLDVAQSALPTSALDRDQLRRGPTISLAHSLDQLAGVRTVSTGQEMGKPVIHGLTGARVLVLDDGHRLQDYSWSEEDGPSVDARMADRVEVVRGPASVLYGSDAIGGVINVVPPPLPDALGRTAFGRYGLELYAASNNREFGSVLRAEGAKGGVGWRVVGIGRKSEALHTPAGELDNTGYSALNGTAAVGLRGDWGNVEARVERYGGEFQLLEASGNPDQSPVVPDAGKDQGPVRKLNDVRTQLDGNIVMGPMLRLEAKTQWQRHELAEVAGDAGPQTSGSEVEGLELLLNTLSMDVLLHREPPGLGSNSTVGVSASYQSSDTRGVVPLIPSASTWSLAAFAYESLTRGPWTLQGGVRGDLTQVSSSGNMTLNQPATDLPFKAWTASVGLVFRPVQALALTANVGRAWRAPNLFELFANGPELGEERYVVGNAGMTPEMSWNGDIGVRVASGRLRAEVDAYQNWMRNYIFLSPTGQVRDSLDVYDYLQARATLRGVDASIELEATRPLTLHARYDYVWGINNETDSPLPLMPPPRLDVGTELHGESLGWAERGYVGADVELVSRQKRLSTFDYPTDGYALVNLGAGLETTVALRRLRADIRVHNALNRSYKSFLSRYKEFALNPGRDIALRLSLGL